MMGSSFTYDMSGAKPVSDIEISLDNPDDIDNLDQDALRRRYESGVIRVRVRVRVRAGVRGD